MTPFDTPSIAPQDGPAHDLAGDLWAHSPPLREIAALAGHHDQGQAFSPVNIIQPAIDQPPAPLVLSCPHAGRIYPAAFIAASAVSLSNLRGLEDFAVDRLVAGISDAVPGINIVTISNPIARAYLDVNRPTTALDYTMFSRPFPAEAATPSRQVRAGYGLLPRLTASREVIHSQLLSVDDASARINLVHQPYHAALNQVLDAAYATHGHCLLLDCHSMPSHDQLNKPLPDIILGDLHHSTLDRETGRRLEDFMSNAGFSSAWNSPYAGGYITKAYGRASTPRQSVQIEINRRLYMDPQQEDAAPSLNIAGAERVRALLGGIASMLLNQQNTG